LRQSVPTGEPSRLCVLPETEDGTDAGVADADVRGQDEQQASRTSSGGSFSDLADITALGQLDDERSGEDTRRPELDRPTSLNARSIQMTRASRRSAPGPHGFFARPAKRRCIVRHKMREQLPTAGTDAPQSFAREASPKSIGWARLRFGGLRRPPQWPGSHIGWR
jgi:hypothetical protein